MLSKAQIKEIRSLEMKKYRDEKQLFIAEGNKLVADMMASFECEMILARASWMATQGDIPARELLLAGDDDIRKVSLLKTPQDVFAVMHKPAYSIAEASPESQLILALDGIQDPGNLGTVIRIADWFGIRHIVCSADTADAFGPKTVQATMGALARVKVHYADLADYLSQHKDVPVYGAFLEGDNIYEKSLSANGVIVMGNEGKGIRTATAALVGERLYIPSFPADKALHATESLNVAVATAIICSEFRKPGDAEGG
jgi:TrmH family RNA methyltransferase